MLFEKDLTCIFDFQRGHRGSDYDALEHAFGKWMDIEISIDRFYVPEKAITVEMEQEATRAFRHDAGLSVSGVVDEDFIERLNEPQLAPRQSDIPESAGGMDEVSPEPLSQGTEWPIIGSGGKSP